MIFFSEIKKNLKDQLFWGTYQGIFWKEKTKGYLSINLYSMVLQMNLFFLWTSNLPKNKIFPEYPNLECFYLVIQEGVDWYIYYCFGLAQTFVTWAAILSHRDTKKVREKNIPWHKDICHLLMEQIQSIAVQFDDYYML